MNLGELKDGELYAMFTTENWNKMNAYERLEACQEVENRYAYANNTVPLTLDSEKMMNRAYGYQSGNRIAINSYLLEDNIFKVEIKDEKNRLIEITDVEIEAPGWNVLDTIFHEGTHGIQEQQGRGVRGAAYYVPDVDYDLYRIQPIEKEAYEKGQINTLLAIEAVISEQNIFDPDMKVYSNDIKQDTYEEHLRNASRYYRDQEIEKNIAQVIYDRNNYTHNPSPSREYEQLDLVLTTGQKLSLRQDRSDFLLANDHNQQTISEYYISNKAVQSEKHPKGLRL